MNLSEKICRLCLKDVQRGKGTLMYSNGAKNATTLMVENLLFIKMDFNPDWPSSLCLSCNNNLIAFQKFKQQCFESDQQLKSGKRIFQDVLIKEEPPEDGSIEERSWESAAYDIPQANDNVVHKPMFTLAVKDFASLLQMTHVDPTKDESLNDTDELSLAERVQQLKMKRKSSRLSSGRDSTSDESPNEKNSCVTLPLFKRAEKCQMASKNSIDRKPGRKSVIVEFNSTKTNKNLNTENFACERDIGDELSLAAGIQKLPTKNFSGKKLRARFECPYCSEVFCSETMTYKHVKSQCTKTKYRCADCRARFRTLSKLKKHREIVHDSIIELSIAKCVVCNISFLNPEKLQAHYNKCHGKCRSCKTNLVTSYDLALHENCLLTPPRRESHSEKPRQSGTEECFICLHCNETFDDKSSLICHQGIRHPGKPVNTKKKKLKGVIFCKDCLIFFQDVHQLQRHYQISHSSQQIKRPRKTSMHGEAPVEEVDMSQANNADSPTGIADNEPHQVKSDQDKVCIKMEPGEMIT